MMFVYIISMPSIYAMTNDHVWRKPKCKTRHIIQILCREWQLQTEQKQDRQMKPLILDCTSPHVVDDRINFKWLGGTSPQKYAVVCTVSKQVHVKSFGGQEIVCGEPARWSKHLDEKKNKGFQSEKFFAAFCSALLDLVGDEAEERASHFKERFGEAVFPCIMEDADQVHERLPGRIPHAVPAMFLKILQRGGYRKLGEEEESLYDRKNETLKDILIRPFNLGTFLSKEHITAMTLIVRRRGKLSAPKLGYPKAGHMQGSEYEGEWQMTRSWIWTW